MTSPLYNLWSGMISRCIYPNHISYKWYGAKGVKVCDRWRFGDGSQSGFECWLADMGDRPPGMTIDRIKSEGPYAPDNCRWATPAEQRSNQSASSKERQRAGASAAATKHWQKFREEGRGVTRCHKGHEYTLENTYVRERDGARLCRECGRLAAAERRKRRQQLAVTPTETPTGTTEKIANKAEQTS